MSWVAMTTDVPGFVELDEQAQQPLRQVRIDVAGRLVGEQKLRPRDHRARDRRTLLFSAGEHRRQRRHAIAEPDPVARAPRPHRDSCPRHARSPAAAAPRFRRSSCDRAGGNPGTRSPMRRRSVASASLLSVAMSWPNRVISPRVGRSDRNSRRSSELLPAPEGPVRNWNECGSMRKVRSRRTSGPRP